MIYWFTKALEIEDELSITLVTNEVAILCKICAFQFKLDIEYLWKVIDFYLLLKIMVKRL